MITINPDFEGLIYQLSDDEFSQLKENIQKQGILDSIKVWSGQILDGHNRYRIAKELNLDFQTDEIRFKSETEAKIWIINNQLGRRNLTDVQRIELAKKKNEYLKPLAKENKKGQGISVINNDKINLQSQIAKDAGVSTGKVAQFEYIQGKGGEKLKEEVASSNKKIGTAYREIKEQQKGKEDRKNFIRVPLIKCELFFRDNNKPKEVPTTDKNAQIVLDGQSYDCEFNCVHNTSKLIKR